MIKIDTIYTDKAAKGHFLRFKYIIRRKAKGIYVVNHYFASDSFRFQDLYTGTLADCRKHLKNSLIK